MSLLSERIKLFRNTLSLKQKELAELCEKIDDRENRTKWGQSRIANYETDARTPDLDDIAVIAKALKVDPAELAFGGDNVIPATLGSHSVPLISHVQAGTWTGINDLKDTIGDYEYILTGLEVSEDSFALTIKGDSMEPEFYEGDIVIVDPNIKPIAGEFVVAVNGEYEATFKKYRVVGTDDLWREQFELVPLNSDYPVKSSLNEEIRIVGTMVEHRSYRRKR
ncbi:SOS-response transcriptional repressor LexA (RecA-mediated autopeptidase) [Pasteurella testudinis DSM 23072]|uniref:SOS-response transcriptional repressor LexA (RecA-mediated autopeptidase) n=1 Tax=Pasteurella testudinis DSM 23072 TaxID=1122938 RepID=A0A1W1V3V3_9PAST|nr:XRE family transcriptional regulator [Pasteurella testudinis]SMB88012.1 SOS-response transcriptional repressor LexA (RecA-mediated autopeptidase) [Pasteurella testudinis DSM 23072]SUB51606.1 putative transcriptional regulator [Pasteurella testudinis]